VNPLLWTQHGSAASRWGEWLGIGIFIQSSECVGFIHKNGAFNGWLHSTRAGGAR